MTDPALARLAAVADALEQLAFAVASARADTIAACEAPLEAAVADLPAATELARSTPADVHAQLQRIQLAMRRCRRIGHALGEVVTASLAAQGAAPAYAPAGAATVAPRFGRIEARV